MGRKPSARKMAEILAEIKRVPVCEDCEVLRGANLYAKKHYGTVGADLFTTHVDLGCKACPVDDIMKLLRKDRFAAIAALF